MREGQVGQGDIIAAQDEARVLHQHLYTGNGGHDSLVCDGHTLGVTGRACEGGFWFRVTSRAFEWERRVTRHLREAFQH